LVLKAQVEQIRGRQFTILDLKEMINFVNELNKLKNSLSQILASLIAKANKTASALAGSAEAQNAFNSAVALPQGIIFLLWGLETMQSTLILTPRYLYLPLLKII
jgi:hypothetical protein